MLHFPFSIFFYCPDAAIPHTKEYGSSILALFLQVKGGKTAPPLDLIDYLQKRKQGEKQNEDIVNKNSDWLAQHGAPCLHLSVARSSVTAMLAP